MLCISTPPSPLTLSQARTATKKAPKKSTKPAITVTSHQPLLELVLAPKPDPVPVLPSASSPVPPSAMPVDPEPLIPLPIEIPVPADLPAPVAAIVLQIHDSPDVCAFPSMSCALSSLLTFV